MPNIGPGTVFSMIPEPYCLHVSTLNAKDQMQKGRANLLSVHPIQTIVAKLQTSNVPSMIDTSSISRSLSYMQNYGSSSAANYSVNSCLGSIPSDRFGSRYCIKITSYAHASLGYKTNSQGSLVETRETRSNIMLLSHIEDRYPILHPVSVIEKFNDCAEPTSSHCNSTSCAEDV